MRLVTHAVTVRMLPALARSRRSHRPPTEIMQGWASLGGASGWPTGAFPSP
ncbi:MAG: hypothetical protein ACR2P2_01625 [Nakamurella sp.]